MLTLVWTASINMIYYDAAGYSGTNSYFKRKKLSPGICSHGQQKVPNY